jgi:hypothetical protein
MQKLFYVALLLLALASCKKSKVSVPNMDLRGNYTGTFQRFGPEFINKISNVTLNFSPDKWSGQSDMAKYPALCNGTYKIADDKVTFLNACGWYADFDWTLILKGEYELTRQNNTVTFTKSGANYKDVYTLTKE